MFKIEEKAMLVKVSVSRWYPKAPDKRAAKAVENQFGSSALAGKYIKQLADGAEIKAVSDAIQALRDFNYANTLPWKDDGYRILPSASFQKYSAKVRELEDLLFKAVDTLADALPTVIAEAKVVLNGLFNEADYPSPQELRSRHAVTVDISPIPSGPDFRVQLAQEDITSIQSSISARTDAAIKAAHNDLYKRLAETVGRMAERLSQADAVFRDTLVSNVCELLELIPNLNITEDAKLEELRKIAADKLCKVTPAELRSDKAARADVARDAKSILAAMEGMF